MGDDYFSLSELGRASEYFTKAFQLREHASEREKLDDHRQLLSTLSPGNWIKQPRRIRRRLRATRENPQRTTGLGVVFAVQGQYEKAAEITRQAVRLAPDALSGYTNLANYALALQRFDEARQIIHEAQARKLDDSIFHECSLRSCLSRGGLRGDGGTATVVCGQARRELWTCARIRHRGVCRSSRQGAGTDQAGGGLRHPGGQQGKWGNLSGECCSAGSRLRQCRRSPAVSGRGSEAGSRESGRRERSRACVCHGGRYGDEPNPWHKT